MGGFSHGRNLNTFRGGRVAGFQSPGRGKGGKNQVRATEGDNLRFKGEKMDVDSEEFIDRKEIKISNLPSIVEVKVAVELLFL